MLHSIFAGRKIPCAAPGAGAAHGEIWLPLLPGPFEGFPVVGMCDGNEGPGTFTEIFAIQVHGAIFCDNPVCLRAGDCYAGTHLEGRYELG